MNNVNILNIRLFENNSKQEQIKYSKEIDRKQEITIRHKILSIAHSIRSQLPKEDIQDLKFVMKSNGEFRIIVRMKDKDVEYNFDNLDSKVKKEASLLIDIVKRLNITSLKDAPKAPSYPLIQTHTTFTNSFSKPEPKSVLQRAATFFQTFFSFYGFVRPLTNRLIGKEIDRSLGMTDLKNLYINNQDLLNQIKQEIRTKHPSIFEHYSESEINSYINDQLIHRINDRLARLNMPPLSEKTLYQLDVQRILKHIATKGLSKDGYSSLMKVNPLDMPLKELAEVPVTSQEEDALAEIWKGVIGNLFAKGRLDKLSSESDERGIIVQTAYVNHYLEALELMPEPIKRDLADFIAELNQKQSPEALQDFIIQHSAITDGKVKTADPLFKEKQIAYREKIQPQIKIFLEKVLKKAKDSSLVVKYLTMQGTSYAKIERLTNEIWKSLSEDESKLYDKETIKKFIFNELEHKAVFDYHFSTPQIANLRSARHGDEMKGKHKEIIEDNIETYTDKRSALKANYKKELQLERSQTIDPLVELPPLELPLELASEEDRQATIQEILSQIPQSLQLIEKNLKQIDKEVKNLQKVQGRKATEAKESIKAKLLEKSELEAKKSSLEALKVAKQKGDRELLNKLLSEMATISVKSRKVDVTTLNPLYITALQDALKIEEKKLAELDEKISQIHNHREAKKLGDARPPIKAKIDGLKALFERIEKIKKNHGSVNQIEKRYQAKLQKLDGALIAGYETLLNSYVSIEALQSFAKNPYLADLYPIMWEKALKKLLDATPAAIGPAPKFDQALKKSLQPYIQAKAKLLSLSMAEDAKIIEMLDRIESRIQTEEVKNYIQEAAQNYQEPTVEEMLFDEEVLNHITTPESSPFKADQQADLMRLTKLFKRAARVEVKRGKPQPPVPLTGAQKQELKEALNRLEKDDSIFEALKRFSSNDDREDVEQFLSFIPPFIRWIAKKFMVNNAKKVEKFIPGGITKQSIEFLTTYLSKTKKITKEEAAIKQLHSKAETLIAKYRENPESITPAERLSLKELGIISRVARLNESDDEDKKSFLAQLDALGLIEVDPKLQDLKELAQKSQALLKEIDELIRPSINAHYKDGDLLAYVGNKKSTWMGTPISFEERMTMFAANGFTHGAKLYRKNDEVQISHIYGNLEQDKISLYQLCISDVWELDVVPLVPASMQEVLKEVYGENWKTTINELYQSIEQELHTKGATQFADVGNNQERRLAAGFADHPLLFKLLGKEGIKGHEKEFERDFNQIHGKFFEGAPLHDDQICSEFASKATLVSMIELNKRLTRDIQAKLGNDYFPKEVLAKLNANGTALPSEVKDYLQGIRHFKKDREITKKAEKDLKQLLKNNGYTPQEINLIIRLGNEEVLDLPYSKKERLKAIHPGRMVSLLVDKKCARLRPPPKAVEALIAMK